MARKWDKRSESSRDSLLSSDKRRVAQKGTNPARGPFCIESHVFDHTLLHPDADAEGISEHLTIIRRRGVRALQNHDKLVDSAEQVILRY